MAAFVMPEVGSDRYVALVAKWQSQPVSFGSLNLIRQLFRKLGDFSHVAISDDEKRILEFRSVRNDEGHYVNLNRERYNQWQAHQLIELLNKAISAGVSTRKTPAKPVETPVASNDAPVIEHGQLIMVSMHGRLETKRVTVVGNRVTLGKP